MSRQRATFDIEHNYWSQGFSYIVGLDEVGRGAWAGPVVAAAVIFPAYITLPILPRDSKTLSEKQRYELKAIIETHAYAIGIGEVPSTNIDQFGIVPSTQQSMYNAIKNLPVTPTFYLIDGHSVPFIPESLQKALPKGDTLSATIASASIIAKIYRDELMTAMAKEPQYTVYEFNKHKGYGTALHRQTIKKHGISSIHRRSFVPQDIAQGVLSSPQ